MSSCASDINREFIVFYLYNLNGQHYEKWLQNFFLEPNFPQSNECISRKYDLLYYYKK